MNGIDDLTISLTVLIGLRLTATLVFIELYIREREVRYAAILLGWFAYAIGPAFGLLAYYQTGNSNHPLFGYSAAIGTLLLMGGLILYHFKTSIQSLLKLAAILTIIFGSLLFFFPGMSGHFGVTAQLILILSTLIVILFKRRWVISLGGIYSYIWLSLFLLSSLFLAFGFQFWLSNMPISFRFTMTFLVNLILLMFFLHFDREQSFRRIHANEEKISSSLKEKEILLKEIHHRVKNNMAIINSLLALQAPYLDSPAAKEQFTLTQNRIKAMSIVHEKLYMTNDFSSIDFKEYIEALTQQILHTLGGGIKVELDISPFKLEPDTLIPCGLIINEVLSNSFKHAFEISEDKIINLSANRKDDGTIFLTIKDNGKGIPAGLIPSQSKGLGLKLVDNLIMQLNGQIEVKNDNGTVFNFVFPEKIKFAGRG